MTADNCYWTRMQGGQMVCVRSDDNVAPDFLRGEGVEMTPVKEYEPCSGCSYVEDCMDGRWGDGRQMNPPAGGLQVVASLTVVHTCRTCGKNSLSEGVWDGCSTTREVPAKCPRWDALDGSGLECDSCTELRVRIRKSHPRYKERAESLTANIVAAVKGEKDKREAAREMALATVSGFRPGDMPSEVLAFGQEITGKFLFHASFHFSDLVPEMGAAPIFISEWLEWMVLAFRMDQSPEFLARAFSLVFNETPPFNRVWSEMNLSVRTFLVRTWEGLIRESLGDAT